MSYVYIRSEPGLWTVGFYDPAGKWIPESDHDNRQEAAERVHYLNGGKHYHIARHPSQMSAAALESGATEELIQEES